MNNETKQKLDGTINQASGAIKSAAGSLTNDEHLKTEGKIDTLTGKTQVASATAKEKLKEGVRAAGDAIEHAGENLIRKGFEKAGTVIKNAGDAIEHALDKK